MEYRVINVIKTYAWIKETPNSRIDSISIRGNEDSIIGEERQNPPKRLIKRWPATILADSRTESVIGRIKFLTSSIKTMKFIS